MPKQRKTKAELEAERAEAKRQAELEQAEWYKENLMPTMERACQFNYKITVKDNSFYLRCRDGYENGLGYDPDGGCFILNLDYNDDSYWNLRNLTTDLDRRQEYENEQERILDAKVEALRKLSKEERDLLGLENPGHLIMARLTQLDQQMGLYD